MSMRVMLRKQEALLDKLVALAGSAVRVEEVILALHRELGDSPTLRQVIRRILERRHAKGGAMSETEERIERYEVRDGVNGLVQACRTWGGAEAYVAAHESNAPHFGPYRIVHLVELRPGERIVREGAL